MTCLIINEENAGQSYSDFAYTHPLCSDGMKISSEEEISRFLERVTSEQRRGILNDWNARQNHKKRIYLSLDTSRQAGGTDIVEWRKAEEEQGLSSSSLSLAYDAANQRALFYTEYPRYIDDLSQLKYLGEQAVSQSYSSIGFILDRGAISKESIQYMDEKGYSFLMMLKAHKDLVFPFVKKLRGSFETNRDCLIPVYRVYGTTIRERIFSGDRKKRYLHVFFSPRQMAAERNQLEERIEQLSITLAEREERERKQLGKIYRDYFDCVFDENQNQVLFKENKERIQKALDSCGYFCLISSEKMDAKEAYELYTGHGSSEKLFQEERPFLGRDFSIAMQSREAESTSLLLTFIALIVRNRIYSVLKTELLRTLFMTVPDLLKELEKIEMLRSHDGSYVLDHGITETQRRILQAFGINEESVKDYACKISALLAKAPKCSFDQDKDEELYPPEI